MKTSDMKKRFNKSNPNLATGEMLERFNNDISAVLDKELSEEEALLLFTTDLRLCTSITDCRGIEYIYEYLID